MINIKDKTKCCGCFGCYNICPANAIKMEEDEKGFKYPKVDKEKCVNCQLCEKVCPILNTTTIKNMPIAYACINKNDIVRKSSSSGGIFTLLAEDILNRKGVVFGACFNERFEVIHSYIEDQKDIQKLRGSKYVQSSINDMYKKAKEFLEKDRYVLFTGTPCQIEGLKCYLRRDYDKLYTQDIICHGVPSPKVWRKYLEFRSNKGLYEIKNIEFRNKDNGWHLYNLKIELKNETYSNNQNNDDYMKAFLRNTSLRESCYNCCFKKENRISDVTLADFWGVEKICPKIDDDKGVSLVIINSEKGKKLFDSLQNKILYDKTDLTKAIQYNKSMIKSSIEDHKRELFFESLDKIEFDKLVKRHTSNPNYLKKISKKIVEVIKK